jgi:prepilin peptidase CpaA
MVSCLDIFLTLFCGLAIAFDVMTHRIPNWFILIALIGGFVFNAWNGNTTLMNSLAGFALGIGIFFIPFALGIVGAGDVKLVGAVGAILGAGWLPRVLFYTVCLGGLLALVSVILRGLNGKAFTGMWQDIKVLVASQGKILPEGISAKSRQGAHTIPYGVAIALGTLVAFYIDPEGRWAGF